MDSTTGQPGRKSANPRGTIPGPRVAGASRSPSRTIALGIVGAAGRGAAFRKAIAATGRFHVAAVCELNAERAAAAAEAFGADHSFTEYEAMLEDGGVSAVLIGTPMPLHAPQSIAALERDIHVLSEVPAAVNLEEAQRLVMACRRSSAVYMIAENYTFIRENMMVREMVRAGLFGEPYYAEGEYLHELKEHNERTPWRRRWQTGVNGITYPTHSLGPILQWMPGDRVVSVCCAGSGHHYRDPRGREYENEDTCVMLCRMKSGGLVKIRLDMLSDRPHAMNIYQLQGTEGAYESPRAPGEKHRIWLRSRHGSPDAWRDLASLEQEFLPAAWREHAAAAAEAGHGGGDFLELLHFADVIEGRQPNDLPIDAAMDMTLPGLASQQSIVEGGRWVDVPDSRAWGE